MESDEAKAARTSFVREVSMRLSKSIERARQGSLFWAGTWWAMAEEVVRCDGARVPAALVAGARELLQLVKSVCEDAQSGAATGTTFAEARKRLDAWLAAQPAPQSEQLEASRSLSPLPSAGLDEPSWRNAIDGSGR